MSDTERRALVRSVWSLDRILREYGEHLTTEQREQIGRVRESLAIDYRLIDEGNTER